MANVKANCFTNVSRSRALHQVPWSLTNESSMSKNSSPSQKLTARVYAPHVEIPETLAIGLERLYQQSLGDKLLQVEQQL